MRSEREHEEPWTRRVRERKEEKVAEGEEAEDQGRGDQHLRELPGCRDVRKRRIKGIRGWTEEVVHGCVLSYLSCPTGRCPCTSSR
jgi:hypothetical protein